jgi:hypothetical protein
LALGTAGRGHRRRRQHTAVVDRLALVGRAFVKRRRSLFWRAAFKKPPRLTTATLWPASRQSMAIIADTIMLGAIGLVALGLLAGQSAPHRGAPFNLCPKYVTLDLKCRRSQAIYRRH